MIRIATLALLALLQPVPRAVRALHYRRLLLAFRFALLQFDPGPALLAACAKATQPHLAGARPKELVYLMWAYAQLAQQPPLSEVSALAAASHALALSQLSSSALQSQVRHHWLPACASLGTHMLLFRRLY